MAKPRLKPDHDYDVPVFLATKKGKALRLERDPDPETKQYMVMDVPGMLILFQKPKNGDQPVELPEFLQKPKPDNGPDRNAQLRHAFGALKERVRQSPWASSSRPYASLIDAFQALRGQDAVREDVAAYLSANPAVKNAVEMLFTSISMSARADWKSAPTHIRGTVARGWFLGRWVPTFLVLDGPILRFLKSHAFRRQDGRCETLRAVRALFEDDDFRRLRNAIAHWSFSWDVVDGESEIVGYNEQSGEDEIRVRQREADALHIITFAVVEAIHEVFLKKHDDS